MPLKIHIDDDFDLDKIRISGQCFRISKPHDDLYRLISRDKVLYMKELGEGGWEISCTQDEWDDFWKPYFDLERNYSEIRKRNAKKNDFIDAAMAYGEGLRILKQDPWEMLVTFIISQRKNMPAIANAVERISERFGTPICFDGENAGIHEKAFAFPIPEQLCQATEQELLDCGLGYRAKYIVSAARQVTSGELDLEQLSMLDNEELFAKLKSAYGVGDKVANCICLFGYGRTSQVPVDVWIQRAIDNECSGDDPFAQYGDDAGIMQQYVFFFMTDRERQA